MIVDGAGQSLVRRPRRAQNTGPSGDQQSKACPKEEEGEGGGGRKRRSKQKQTNKKKSSRLKSVLSSKTQRVKTKRLKVEILLGGGGTLVLFHCLLVPLRQVLCDWSVSEHQRFPFGLLLPCVVVVVFVVIVYPLRCYCSVRCSLVSPCLDGWLGDGAWEGCVPEGRLWAMGTPPGTRPSSAPGRPPGATPTMPAGYLEEKKAAEDQRSD